MASIVILYSYKPGDVFGERQLRGKCRKKTDCFFRIFKL